METPTAIIMKKIIGIFWSAILFIGATQPLFADECRPFDQTNDCISIEETDDAWEGYTLGEFVYYGMCQVVCADPKTFKVIKTSLGFEIYGKDKSHVFFFFFSIDGLNANKFKFKKTELADYYLAYDGINAYLNAMPLPPNADPETFEFLDTSSANNTSWFKDANNVYYLEHKEAKLEEITQVLQGADPSFFLFGYKITSEAVYWYGVKIPKADPKSFELMHMGYAKDKDNVYKDGKVVYGADTKSFHEADIEGINIFIFIDKNKGYFGINAPMKTLKEEHKDSIDSIDQSLKTSVKAYETKYPGYKPKPAQPPAGSPEAAELAKMEAETQAEQTKQIALWGGSALGGLIVLGGVLWMWKRKK